MKRININGTSLSVQAVQDTFLINNKDVARGFGVSEETIRYQKTQGSAEYLDGIHFTTVGNPNGGPEKTVWTKKGIILLGFRLRETCQTIAFRDWAIDFILEQDSSIDIQQGLDRKLLSANTELLKKVSSDQKSQMNMMQILIENMPVTNLQQNELIRIKNEKVEELIHGDKQLANKAHRKIWSLFKQHFHLPRYNELPQSKFEEGQKFILSLTIRDVSYMVAPWERPLVNTLDYNDEIPF